MFNSIHSFILPSLWIAWRFFIFGFVFFNTEIRAKGSVTHKV